jgi:hypothetical protein
MFWSIRTMSMISGSVAAFSRRVWPSARTAERMTLSVAPTEGYGSAIDAPRSFSATFNMLPDNKIRRTMMKNLTIQD